MAEKKTVSVKVVAKFRDKDIVMERVFHILK